MTTTKKTNKTTTKTVATKTKKAAAPRRKPAERAILFAGLVGGLTRDQTIALLKEAGYRDVPEKSWEMLNKTYLPKFMQDPKLLGESIYAPRAASDL